MSESDLEANLEDDPDHETASEEEPEPLPMEEVVFNSLEMAQMEEDRHLRAITQKETDDCILKRVVEISKEEERRRKEEERHHEVEETERRLAMDAEWRWPRAERKKREEEHRQQGDDDAGSTGNN